MNGPIKFSDKGTSTELRSNKPLFLADDRFWVVETGEVDVFSVALRDGSPYGSRSHVFRADDGTVLCGLSRRLLDQKGRGLLAVGTPGTTVRELSRAEITEVAETAGNTGRCAQGLDQWISGLYSGVSGRMIFPKDAQLVTPGRETQVEKDTSFRPGKGVVWVRGINSRIFLCGNPEWSAYPEENIGFPISAKAWYRTEHEIQLRGIHTRAAFEKQMALSFLDYFHSVILDCLSKKMDAQDATDQERFESRQRIDRMVISKAYARLAAVIPKKDGTELLQMMHAQPLVSACTIVGKHLNIPIAVPKIEPGVKPDIDMIARASKIRIRETALRDIWWKKDNGPLLAFREEDSRPVALIPASASSYQLVDPEKKTTERMSFKAAETLKPFAYTFYRPFPDEKITLRKLFVFGMAGTGRDILFLLLFGVIGALLGLLFPWATGKIFSDIIPQSSRSELVQLIVILGVCVAARTMFSLTRAVASLRIQGRMDQSLQSALWDRILKLPVPFFRDYTAGDLAQRSMSISALRQMMSEYVINTVLVCIFSSFNLLFLFYYSWELALVGLALVGFAFLVTFFTLFFQLKYQKQIQELEGRIAGIIFQFITGIQKLRVAGTEHRAFSVWADKFAAKKKLAFRSGVIQNVLESFNAVFPLLSSMVIFAWLIYYIEPGEILTGDFLAFNSAFINFQTAMLSMTAVLPMVLTAIPLYNRMRPILETMPEADENRKSPGEITGRVEISHVNFRYQKDGPLILSDVSLSIDPGEFVALVGSSGSGKSTLFRLMLGFEAPESGTIYYDEKDLSTVDPLELRRQMGVVLQNAQLMTGDIFKNIVGSSRLTVNDAWEAARMVGLEEDIKSMPMGMHTVVSEGGGNLSGGQRQRMMIARAIIHKPRVLFFDEATSALDNRTQKTVTESLEKLQTTRIVIAHRLSTIINADRIYVLEHGELVEQGSHDELMDQQGFYYNLANRQMA